MGVVGIGFGQAVHVPAFRSDPRCEVVAISASTSARAAQIAGRLGIAAAYADWRDLVASPRVDLVSVAVPPAVQPDVVIAAAAARKPVFCEKPLAVDVASAERMLTAVRESGVKHAIDLEFAELPVWRTVKQMIDDGAIGRARSCTMTWHVRTRSRPADSWKQRPDAGGGALAGFASHLLYLLEWCLGRAARVAAKLDAEGGRARVEAALELESECRAAISIATDATTPTGLRAELSGDRATLLVRNTTGDHVHGHTLQIRYGLGELEAVRCADVPAVVGDARIAAVAPLVSRFIDAIRGGEAMHPDLVDGVRVQRLLDALVVSDRDRDRIRV